MKTASSHYKIQIDMTKLFICGSRTITDRKWVFSKIDECIANNHFTDVTILEGTAKGVDEIAKDWAIEHNAPVIEYPPDYEKYHHKACHKRNEAMAKDCDFMLDLWTGESTGSLHDIIMAEKYHKPYKVCIYSYDKIFTDAATSVLLYHKEIFLNSENPKDVFHLFKKELYKCVMAKGFMDPEWEEGHNTGSSFWIMPVKQGKDSSEGAWGCYCCYADEISIDEDVVLHYLYHQFLEPHYDTSIKYTCKNYPEPEFDWNGYNLYTYETVRKMAEEMKTFTKDVSLGKAVSDFYITLADRLLLMMERQPDWEYITFEGP